ncbi:MAG: VOC family protein [Acidimicrobiales bacterium]
MPEPHELNYSEIALARALYAPLRPVEPERRFANRLRARLERALTLPKGVDVTTTTLTAAEPARFPEGTRHGDVGYISFEVPELDRAIAFYGGLLGWEFRPARDPSARRLLDSMPNMELHGGHPSGLPVICWRVDDLDTAVEIVRSLGGSATEPVAHDYGTTSDCTDDQAMRFYLWEPTEVDIRAGARVTERPLGGTRHGDLAYLTLGVGDSERFRTFFGAVLGWSFVPGHVADGWQVTDPMPMHGMAGGADQPSTTPMWRVDDIGAAVEMVALLGGSAGPVERQPYGLSATCSDDQGTRFYLLGQA